MKDWSWKKRWGGVGRGWGFKGSQQGAEGSKPGGVRGRREPW